MENNISNNTVEGDVLTKKNNPMIIIVALIILALIIIVILKKEDRIEITPEPLSQTEMDLNSAVSADTTTSINGNLDSINVDDTSSTDLNEVDQELNKL
jgi:hypothetical protein